MGNMLRRTPEYRAVPCRVICSNLMDSTFDGADAVAVVLMAGSRRVFAPGEIPAWKYGYDSSDNIPPNLMVT